MPASVSCPSRSTADRRVSVNDAYLEPARDRPNLTVLGGAVVDRLLLDGAHARGVRLADGRELESDEVILSAGAIGSPAILLRSGLQRPGIGANLQDHPSFRLVLWLEESARAATADVVPATTMLRWSSGGGEPSDLQALALDVSSASPAGTEAGLLMGAVDAGALAGDDVALASSTQRRPPSSSSTC